MHFVSTLVGSYPPLQLPPRPLDDEQVARSIRRAVDEQLAAIQDKNVDWLFVSGQPQSDVVGIFAPALGLVGQGLPYQVVGEVRYSQPITQHELELTAEATGGRPLKAHLTGPTLLAESCEFTSTTPTRYREPAGSHRALTLDIARALAEEARFLTRASHLPVAYLQIDEPSLAYGANLSLAREALEIIADASTAPTILHVCGDIGDIVSDLLQMPVHILNLEHRYLRKVTWLDAQRLADSHKQLALGCLPVNTLDIPSARLLERELILALEQYGRQNIWGITPTCGLRMNSPEDARERLRRLVEVAHNMRHHLGNDEGGK